MKKKLCYLLIVSMLITSCVGCKKQNDNSKDKEETKVEKTDKQDNVSEDNIQTKNEVASDTMEVETIEETSKNDKTQETTKKEETKSTTTKQPTSQSNKKETSTKQETTKQETSQNNKQETTGNNNTKHTHSYSKKVTKPTCDEQGFTTNTCSCGDTYIDNYTSAKGHAEVIDKAVAATTTSTGLTEGKHCSVCGIVLVAQNVVPVVELKPSQKSSFTFQNNLSDKYSYNSSSLLPYTICKVNSVDYSIEDWTREKIALKVTLLFEKTFQNTQSSLKNLKINYTLSRDNVVVKTGFITILNTEMGVQYEETLTFNGLPAGNYSLRLSSY